MEGLERINNFILDRGFYFQVAESDVDGGFLKPGSNDGRKIWCIMRKIDDGVVACSFGDWRSGEIHKVYSQESLSQKQERLVNKFYKDVASKREADACVAKAQVEELWDGWKRQKIESNGDYLVNKRLQAPSSVVVVNSTQDHQQLLVIPMVDEEGELWNVQKIYRSGKKVFHTKGRTSGVFHVIGGQTDKIYVGEGFATCLAVNQYTQNKVYVAFSTRNLEEVVKVAIRMHGPQSVVLLADYDGATQAKTGENPGMHACQRLSAKYRLAVAVPVALEAPPETNVDFADAWLTDYSLVLTLCSWEKLSQFTFKRAKEKPEKAAVKETTSMPNEGGDVPKDEPREVPTEPHKSCAYLIEPPHNKDGWKPNYDAITSDILPDRAKNDSIKNTLSNFQTLMTFVGATLRYNVITKEQEWFIPGEAASLDNYKNVLYGRIVDLCARAGLQTSRVDDYLTYLCDQKQFNPVATWIESKPWDGVSRVEAFYDTVKVVGEKHDEHKMRMKRTFIRKWMLMAVAAAYQPRGVSAPGMLVFQGPQYIGKTKWLLSLVPPELNLAVDGKIVDIRDKDSVKQTVRYWLVEMGELDATFKKSDVVALKAFLGREMDTFRPAYARTECNFARRTVFFGSVNERTFLADRTGNRRYWTLEVEKVKWNHGMDMQQVWAELYACYRKGAEWWLNDAEMKWLNESNSDFETVDVMEERLADWGNWSAEDGGEWLTATQILLRMGERPTSGDAQKCASAVRKLNGGRGKRGSHGKSRLLWVPKQLR